MTARKPPLTEAEKQALSTTLKFRIEQLKKIEAQPVLENSAIIARRQIDLLVSAAQKLALP